MVHALQRCGFARSYVISEPEGVVVVDVGSVGAARQVKSYIVQKLGLTMDAVRFIVATHFHIDHIGGIGSLLAHCGGDTKVVFHHVVRHY
ncbi:MAG: MBL fold metallo-hydrolase, partial [Syntrophales bacterium]|nr:MBL fold metallo-hydrolase [Syntrophales bacterium]